MFDEECVHKSRGNQTTKVLNDAHQRHDNTPSNNDASDVDRGSLELCQEVVARNLLIVRWNDCLRASTG